MSANWAPTGLDKGQVRRDGRDTSDVMIARQLVKCFKIDSIETLVHIHGN